MIDISVIIVNWNGKNFLLDCLDSLTRGRNSINVEIIVVDNASSDGSVEAVQHKYLQVKVIRNDKNEGFARANNIGIGESGGKYICLVNSDVKVIDDCLDRMYSFMEEHPSVGISGPRILNPDMTLQYSCRRFPSLWNNFCFAFGLARRFPHRKFFSGEQMSYFPHNSVESVDAVSGCFMMVRREAMDRIGLLDEQFFIYSEDIDWCRRFRSQGWEVVFNPKSKAIHFAGASSGNEPVRFSMEKQRAILKYWAKHHSQPARMILFLILLNHHFLRFLAGELLALLKPSRKGEISSRVQANLMCLRDLLALQNLFSQPR